MPSTLSKDVLNKGIKQTQRLNNIAKDAYYAGNRKQKISKNRGPERQAQAIALRYYDRSSVADIARILDCSENTVKTHLRRAKKTLNAYFAEGDQL